MPHAVLVLCLLHQTGRRRRAFIGGLEKEDIEEDEKGEEAAAALYLFISHAETLLSLPVKPASAKQLLTAAVPVAMPVPECGGHGLHAAGAEPVTPALATGSCCYWMWGLYVPLLCYALNFAQDYAEVVTAQA